MSRVKSVHPQPLHFLIAIMSSELQVEAVCIESESESKVNKTKKKTENYKFLVTFSLRARAA